MELDLTDQRNIIREGIPSAGDKPGDYKTIPSKTDS